MAGSNRKKQRTPKKSKGVHGQRRHPLSGLERALLGKGLIQAHQPIPIHNPWRGVSHVTVPYDAAQVAENRKLYPHLFQGENR